MQPNKTTWKTHELAEYLYTKEGRSTKTARHSKWTVIRRELTRMQNDGLAIQNNFDSSWTITPTPANTTTTTTTQANT